MRMILPLRVSLIACLIACAALGESAPSVSPPPSTGPALDVAGLRRALAFRHEGIAKKDPQRKRALKKLERLTRLAPGEPGPWAALAKIEAETGNASGAESDFREAIRRSGGWNGAAGLYAEYLSSLGRADEAKAVLAGLASLRPGDAWVARLRAEAEEAADPPESRRLYEAILAADPAADDVVLRLARMDDASGNQAAVRARLERLRAAHPRCREILEWQWRCAEASGRGSEAVSLRQFLASQGQACSDLVDWVDAWTATDGRGALAAYRQAAERYPACPGLWRKLGVLQEAAGLRGEAAESYRKAWGESCDDDPYVRDHIRILTGTEIPARKPKAADQWKGNAKKTLASVRGAGYPCEGRVPLGLFRRLASDPSVGDDFRRWVEGWKERAPVEGALLEAESFEASGNLGAADEAYADAVAKRPLDVRPFEPWCRLLEKDKRWGDGVDLARRWMETDLSPRPLAWRGLFLARSGRSAEAWTFLSGALRMDPEHFIAWNEWVSTVEATEGKKAAGSAAKEWAQWAPLDPAAWRQYLMRQPVTGSSITQAQIEQILNVLKY